MKKFNLKKEELEKFIKQLIRYNVYTGYSIVDDFKKAVNELNEEHVLRFNSLDIEPSEFGPPSFLLINKNLLSCDDYTKRVEAMSKIKAFWNCLGSTLEGLVLPEFLSSKKYYQDLDMISKAADAASPLLAIANKTFINSKYHDEDLKLIVEAKDNVKEGEKSRYWMVGNSLMNVAINIDSINSPYHKQDMELIAKSGSKCCSYSKGDGNLDDLATNKVSLGDPYHLENMQILSKAPLARKYLFKLMTDENKIKGKYYRDEVKALENVKSELKAMAIYNYIVNPVRGLNFFVENKLSSKLKDAGLADFNLNLLIISETVPGVKNPKYLDYLKKLNEIDDKLVMFFEALLSNEASYFSRYQEEDLNLLLTVTDFEIFMDLCRVMSNTTSLASPDHLEDVKLISKTTDKRVRERLVAKATDEYSVNNDNHRYDMEYIAKLDFDNISEEQWDMMYHYLFIFIGINDPKHVAMLEKLYNGEKIEIVNRDTVLEYLYDLKTKIESGNYLCDATVVEVNDNEKDGGNTGRKPGVFARMRRKFGNVFK